MREAADTMGWATPRSTVWLQASDRAAFPGTILWFWRTVTTHTIMKSLQTFTGAPGGTTRTTSIADVHTLDVAVTSDPVTCPTLGWTTRSCISHWSLLWIGSWAALSVMWFVLAPRARWSINKVFSVYIPRMVRWRRQALSAARLMYQPLTPYWMTSMRGWFTGESVAVSQNNDLWRRRIRLAALRRVGADLSLLTAAVRVTIAANTPHPISVICKRANTQLITTYTPFQPSSQASYKTLRAVVDFYVKP